MHLPPHFPSLPPSKHLEYHPEEESYQGRNKGSGGEVWSEQTRIVRSERFHMMLRDTKNHDMTSGNLDLLPITLATKTMRHGEIGPPTTHSPPTKLSCHCYYYSFSLIITNPENSPAIALPPQPLHLPSLSLPPPHYQPLQLSCDPPYQLSPRGPPDRYPLCQ